MTTTMTASYVDTCRYHAEELERVVAGAATYDDAPVDIYDWLDAAIDIECRTGLHGDLRSVEITLATGGLWGRIDTAARSVLWGNTASWPISDAVCEALLDTIDGIRNA